MNITSIHLHNFRQYKENKPIDVDVNGKGKNLIVFYGANGHGKSTVMESIQFALLGKRIIELESIPHDDYQKYLNSVINKDAVKSKASGFVRLDLELNNKHILSVLREIVFEKGVYVDKLSLLNGDTPTELIPEQYWEDYLASLVPTDVSEFFFLDGEVIKEVIKKKKADELIKNSSKVLMGFTKLNNLQKDLGLLAEDIASRTAKDKKLKANVEKTNQAIVDLKIQRQRLLNEIESMRFNIASLDKKLEETEEESRHKMGMGIKVHGSKESELSVLLEEEKLQTERLQDLCEVNITLAIAKNIKDSAFIKIDKVINKNQLFLSEMEKNQLHRQIEKYIYNNLKKEYEKGTLSTFSEAIKESLNKIQSTEDQVQYIRGFSKSELTEMHATMKALGENELLKEIKSIFNLRDELSQKKYKVLDKRVNKEIKKFQEETMAIQSEISACEMSIISKRDEVKTIDKKIAEYALKKGKYDDALFSSIVDNKKLETCRASQDVIDTYMKKLLSAKAHEMSEAITKIHGEIAHKDDLVKSIRINPETMDLIIIGEDGNSILPTDLSTGETEIFHLSVLWGLTTISQNRLPILIDAPFEKLDRQHVKNLVTKLLPKLSHQTFLFVHDRELDGKTIKIIKPAVLKAYHVTRVSSKIGSKLTKKQVQSWRAS